jgi:UDP-N-acetylglucosamine pyrophosphorylase
MVYYLNTSFPLRHITLWADANHGILKQAAPSPNPLLIHKPILAHKRDLSTVSSDAVLSAIDQDVLPILLAAGQGTRLGVKGPKGLFQIGGKTLFEWFCEKLPKNSSLAIMTSPLNSQETIDYFKKNDFFGLDVHFFEQEMGEMLDEEKQPTGKFGPNGNGNLFRAFKKAGLAELFQKRGITAVTISYIDNPLSRPLEAGLIENLGEVAVQCILRDESCSSMGAVVEKEGKIEVIEYIDLDPKQKYKYAYSGQIAFDFAFFCKMGEKELPLHWVQKVVDGKRVWKGEQFIFDVFPFAESSRIFQVDRKTHYAPIKGLESVNLALKSLVKQ